MIIKTNIYKIHKELQKRLNYDKQNSLLKIATEVYITKNKMGPKGWVEDEIFKFNRCIVRLETLNGWVE